MNYQIDFQYFLTNENVYSKNKTFWKYHVEKIYGQELENWVIENYGNGKEIRDGNPIYSAKLPNNKALRIILDERNKISPIFASWSSSYNYNDVDVEELVIAIQPYSEIYDRTIELITAYKRETFKALQNKLNNYYGQVTDCNRVSYLRRFFHKTGLKENNWNLTKESVKLGAFDIGLFKKINNVNENIHYYESNFKDKLVQRKYLSLINQLSRVNSTITLNDHIDLTDIRNKREYQQKVLENYSTLYHYCLSYNSKVDKLEDKYKEFEKLIEEKHLLQKSL